MNQIEEYEHYREDCLNKRFVPKTYYQWIKGGQETLEAQPISKDISIRLKGGLKNKEANKESEKLYEFL